MKKWIHWKYLVVLLTFCVMPHLQGIAKVSLSGKVSTLGVGGEVGIGFLDQFNFRVGGHGLNFEYDNEINDIDYDLELKLATFGCLLDWFPFENSSFHLTTGVYYNGNELDATGARNGGTIKIGDTRYPSSLVGRLEGDVEFNDIAPYVGIGFGDTLDAKRHFVFFCDVGVLFHGEPEVSLRSTGLLSSVPAFQEDLKQEEQDLKDEAEKFKFYPVISIGLSFVF